MGFGTAWCMMWKSNLTWVVHFSQKTPLFEVESLLCHSLALLNSDGLLWTLLTSSPCPGFLSCGIAPEWSCPPGSSPWEKGECWEGEDHLHWVLRLVWPSTCTGSLRGLRRQCRGADRAGGQVWAGSSVSAPPSRGRVLLHAGGTQSPGCCSFSEWAVCWSTAVSQRKELTLTWRVPQLFCVSLAF